MEKDGKKGKIRSSAASGAVAVIFLIIGFQAAVFALKVLDRPAAVDAAGSVPAPAVAGIVADSSASTGGVLPQPSESGGRGIAVRSVKPSGFRSSERRREPRKVESFRFDPNTVSIEDMMRLGLSRKQAESIGRYRDKGGKFRRKEDFARMYVVSDSLYARLRDFIDFPKLELNSADSASLTSLKGIGPWYASKIIKRREALGGFFSPIQLMEIRGIDSSRYAGFAESVRADSSMVVRIDIYGASEEVLAAHPYIGRAAASAICRYRLLEGVDSISAAVLVRENILDAEIAGKLKNYL